jgi:uncharacterized protein (DUF934 family)
MPLLDRHGETVHDRWTRIDDATPPPAGPIIVTLARLAAEPALIERPELGVALPAGDELSAPVLDALPRLSLVSVLFPGFRDGRAFTAARALRERHHFTGEIRATGHILPDQYVALLRCGVTTVELSDVADLEPWRQALRLQGGPGARPLIRRMAVPFETV